MDYSDGTLNVAVVGCGHGELDVLYETVEEMRRAGERVDALIVCGDFQAARNETDLASMAVPDKYRKMGDFHRFYSGEVRAPVLTLLIGGNHEASPYCAACCHVCCY